MNTPSSPRHCANCGELLHGHHCSHCGQEDIEYKDSLRHLVPEVLHEYFGFDSQIFASIPALLFKPGFLTKEFNAGRRTKYISPLRLYLIVSALYFFLSAMGIGEGIDTQPIRTPTGNVKTYNLMDTTAIPDSLNPLTHGVFDSTKADSMAPRGTIKRFFLDFGRNVGTHQKQWATAFKDNWPTAMFLLLPVFALLLKLVYIRSKRFYVEHLVYALHLHSFAYLLFSICRLFLWGVPNLAGLMLTIAVFALLFYSLISLKRTYHRTWKTAVPVFVVVSVAYGIIVMVFSLGNVFVAAMRI